jgi:hypothetical protein
MLVFIIFLYITPNFVNYLLKIYIGRVKKQISAMADLLADVKNENGNRHILSAESELTTPLTTLIGYLDKNERIYRTADCHRCHSLNQCCLIKFPNRRSASYLLVMGRLSRQGCPWGISVSIILMMSLSGFAASLFRFKKEEV